MTSVAALSYLLKHRVLCNMVLISSTRKILQIKEGVIHSGQGPKWIIPSKISRIPYYLLKVAEHSFEVPMPNSP